MSSSISIDPNEEGSSSSSKDPKFSPVFMSPGGTFVKPTRPDVKLTPQSSATSLGVDDSKATLTDKVSKELAALNLDLASSAAHGGGSGEEVPGYTGQSWGIKRGKEQDLGLFGGAILVTLPSRMEDVSGVRQVPDHQEVFVDKETDISFIIEILDYEESISDAEAAVFHFNDLAQCNSAVNTRIDSREVFDASKGEKPPASFMSQMPSEHAKCILTGHQAVSKFKSQPHAAASSSSSASSSVDDVLIFLAVIRLPHVGADLLVSLNVPATATSSGDSVSIAHTAKSQSQGQSQSEGQGQGQVLVPVEAFLPSSTLTCSAEHSLQGQGQGQGQGGHIQFAVDTMRTALNTLKVVNYSLFA